MVRVSTVNAASRKLKSNVNGTVSTSDALTSAGAMVGTGHTKFVPTPDIDILMKQGQQSTINTRLQCITVMKEYENKSPEELRCEDYRDLRQLHLLQSSNGDDLRNKWFNKSASLKHILVSMETEFEVALGVESRIWSKDSPSHEPDSLRPISHEMMPISHFDKTLEELSIHNGHVLIIEVKNEDGTWPKDVGYHKRKGKGCENQQLSSTERFKTFHGEIEELTSKATTKRKKLELLNQELSNISQNHKREKKRLIDQETELEKIKKQQETLFARRKQIEAGLSGVKTAELSLSHMLKLKEQERDNLSGELTVLEKDLEEYARTTKDILEKIEPEPQKKEKGSVLVFMAESIKEKEEALTCPVCFEISSAPIFMCQQMHLICSECRPKLRTCPECRERYREWKRHRYAEMMAEELKKLKDLSTKGA